jgi:hypothetical protein
MKKATVSSAVDDSNWRSRSPDRRDARATCGFVFQLLLVRKSIEGWFSGTSKDSEDTLKFAAANGATDDGDISDGPRRKHSLAHDLRKGALFARFWKWTVW